MDWTAINGIAAVLTLVLGFYLGTRRSRARIYGTALEPAPDMDCRIVIENGSDSPVLVDRVSIIWPRGFRLAVQDDFHGLAPLGSAPSAAPAWARSVVVAVTAEPGETTSLDLFVQSDRPDKRISCLMSLHVDETRAMQFSKIRVVKVVQHAVTTPNQASKT